MKLLCNISFLLLWIIALIIVCSINLKAQTGVAIINTSGSKILSGDGAPYELSFVVKETELNSEDLQLLQSKLNAHPERYSVSLYKDDVRPELLLICRFKSETLEQLNQAFRDLLFILKPKSVVFNEEEYINYNAVILK